MSKRNIAFGSFDDDDDEIVVKRAPRRMGEWKESAADESASEGALNGGGFETASGAEVQAEAEERSHGEAEVIVESVPESGEVLPGLSGEPGFSVRPSGMTKEEALKYEINGFAKERPEDVAALIKSILRGEQEQ